MTHDVVVVSSLEEARSDVVVVVVVDGGGGGGGARVEQLDELLDVDVESRSSANKHWDS